MSREFRLLGKIFIRGIIETKTGLYIGGNEVGLAIGGADSTVIRNAYNGEPYIPGSSLKGKMRSMLDRIYTPGKLDYVGNVRIFKVNDLKKYVECPIFNLFGVTPDDIKRLNEKDNRKEGDENWVESLPTRLIFRDANMSAASVKVLKDSRYTDMPFTQVKTEVVLDRITSAAMPRQFERVPAGVEFEYEIVMNIYQDKDLDWLGTITEAMELLEADYLGGQGSRGYGKVRFATRKVEVKAYNNSGIQADNRLTTWQKAFERNAATVEA